MISSLYTISYRCRVHVLYMYARVRSIIVMSVTLGRFRLIHACSNVFLSTMLHCCLYLLIFHLSFSFHGR